MCLSASVSFTTGAVMVCVGLASIWSAKSKPWIMFAAIPLLFGIQQITEGVVWLFVNYEPGCIIAQVAALYFLITALVVWPTWLPYSIYVLEKEQGRRKSLLKILTFWGAVFSLGALFILIYFPIDFSVYQSSILYDVAGDVNFHWGTTLTLYCIFTVLPLFISSHKMMRIFGTLLIVSLSVSIYCKYQQLVSVWCFMAAVLSFILFFIVRHGNKTSKEGYEVS